MAGASRVDAAITPTKAELIAAWAPTRPWGPHNDRFELTKFRRPMPGPRPAIGLTARWQDDGEAVVLAEVRER